MPNAFVYKPFSTGSRNRGGLSVIVDGTRDQYKSVGIYDQNDNLLEDLSYTPNVPEPGKGGGDPATKFYSQKPGSSFGKNIKTRVTYADGRTEDYNIEDSSQYYRGTIGQPDSLQAMDPGAGGGGGGSQDSGTGGAGGDGGAPGGGGGGGGGGTTTGGAGGDGGRGEVRVWSIL